MNGPQPYEPEIGQACFGQPFQRYECDAYIEAALAMIGYELQRVMWNKNQKVYESPFDNTGNRFDCPLFSAHAYSWNDDEEQPWNFKWKDVEISWYKRLGRGMSINRPFTPDECALMLKECLEELQRMDPANL